MTRFFDGFPSAGPATCERFNDFVSDEEATEFVVTAINGGSASVVDTERGGALVLTGAATTDDSGAEAQDDVAWISLAAGKRLMIRGLVKPSDADQQDFYMGVATLDTSIIASEPTNAIYFKKLDETAVLSLVVRAGGSQTGVVVTSGVLEDGVFARLDIDVQPSPTSAALGDVLAYKDGSLIGALRNVVLPTGLMGRCAAFQSGNATGTHTSTIDYVGARFDR